MKAHFHFIDAHRKEWLGFVTLLTIYWCFFVAATTGRIGWCLLTGWLLPILALTISFRKGMQVNGLMVLICFVLFLVCRSGLAELRGWNVKQRKKRPVLFWLLYTVIFLLMFYSVAQAQMQGYILNIQGWDSETMQVLRMVLVTIPLLVLNYFYTEMVYTAIDRLRLKKWELVLLNCRCFLAHESGAEKVAKQGYFLEGISNGVTYHFELTKRTYFMLRREKNLRLQIGTGILGGLYLTDLENPDFFKRVRRMDRKYAKRGIFLNILVMAFGVWLFWILK